MASIMVSVPDPLREWVESRVEGGGYQTASDYLRDLIDRDRTDSEAREALIEALERGEASGTSPRNVADIFAALKRERDGAAV